MRITALFPLACAITAFVLGMLCLFAGHKPGFMEDYHIISLNTSTLGHNLIPSETTESGPTPTATSVGSFFSNLAKNVTGEIEDEIEEQLNDFVGDIADKLADVLGIDEWYSLHLMTLCEGEYSPNATHKGARKNVTHCTNQTAMFHFDITKQISQDLSIGKLNISLDDINWPDAIQDGLNGLNTALNATFVIYAIAIASQG